MARVYSTWRDLLLSAAPAFVTKLARDVIVFRISQGSMGKRVTLERVGSAPAGNRP